jgi:hypothetical protein
MSCRGLARLERFITCRDNRLSAEASKIRSRENCRHLVPKQNKLQTIGKSQTQQGFTSLRLGTIYRLDPVKVVFMVHERQSLDIFRTSTNL